VKQEFKELSEEYTPRWVLHHPHTAVKRRTWLASWRGLTQADYVGSGVFSRKDKGWDGRDNISEVLADTKKGEVMDVIVHMDACFNRSAKASFFAICHREIPPGKIKLSACMLQGTY
jgi:hypothetical protein